MDISYEYSETLQSTLQY